MIGLFCSLKSGLAEGEWRYSWEVLRFLSLRRYLIAAPVGRHGIVQSHRGSVSRCWHLITAPKGRHGIAQGNALGNRYIIPF